MASAGDDEETPTAQDRLLDALLYHRLEEFLDLLHDRSVRADHKYGKPHYATCLEIACRRVDKGDFVEALLKTAKVRPYVNCIVPEPIHYAAKVGAYDALKHLLQHKKTDINIVDAKGDTALHYLSANYTDTEDKRFRRCMELLITRHDLDINKPNKRGYTPIHQAAYYDCREMVNLILKYRSEEVDLDSNYASGRNARTFLCQKYPDLCQKLPEIKYSSVRGYENQILVAFQNRHLDVFCGLLRQVDREGNPLFDPDFSYGKPYNATCLEMACRQIGYQEYLKVLLEAGADPNRVNRTNYKAPIHLAAETLNYDALNVLLDCPGICSNAVDKDEWTALHHAVAANPAQDSELSDKESQSSYPSSEETDKPQKRISKAESTKSRENRDNLEKCIVLLYDHITSDLNLEYLINLANSRGNKKAVEILENLEPKQRIVTGQSIVEPLDGCKRYAVNYAPVRDKLFEYVHKEQTEEFITEFTRAVSVDSELVSCTDSSGNTLLQVAVASDLLDIVEILLKNGADPNKCCNRRPAIVTAAKQQNLSILKLLLNQSCINVDASDMKGDTALHHIVREENLECAVALLNSGANIKKQNVLGKTPLSLKGLKALLDKSLMTNKHYFPQQEDYEVIFDYTLITANRSQCVPREKRAGASFNPAKGVTVNIGDNGAASSQIQEQGLLKAATEEDKNENVFVALKAETELLHYISDNYRTYRTLLDHPVISSFLQFKWDCVKLFFYVNLAFFLLFFVMLNLFIMFDPHPICETRNSSQISTVTEEGPPILYSEVSKVFWFALVLLTIPLSLRELIQFLISPLRYVKSWENYLDLVILVTTWVIIASAVDKCWLARLDVVAIMLSCVELILLIGRHPTLSLNIEMLKAVSMSYLGFLLSYVFLIVAFSHCMFIVFRDNMQKENVPPFLWAICRTIVFMTGEYDAKDLDFGTLPYTTVIVFLLFVFFISIVLLNLLIGLSVNDTRSIQDKSKVLAITCRIHIVYEIETVVLEWYKTYKRWCPKRTCLDKCFRFVILFHNKPHQKRVTTLPNKEGSIKDHPFGKGVKVEQSVLEEAVRMISASQQRNIDKSDADKKLDLWERSVLEMLTALKKNYSFGRASSTL